MPDIRVKADPSPLTPVAVRLARWAIPRLPAGVTPNHVTMAGFGLMVLAGLSFLLAGSDPRWFVLGGAAMLGHFLLDNLDGELARARGLASERGFFLDLMLDALSYVAVLLGLAYGGYAHLPLVILYPLIVLLRGQLLLHWILLRGRFEIPFPGPSEFPFLVIGLALLTVWLGGPALMVGPYALSPFDLAALVLIPFSLLDFVRDFVRLYRELAGPGR